MDKKMPKKISLKDFGMEKIILIAIAGMSRETALC